MDEIMKLPRAEQEEVLKAGWPRPYFTWSKYRTEALRYVNDLHQGFVPYHIDIGRTNNFLDYVKGQFMNSWRLWRNALLVGVGGGCLLGALYAIRSRLTRGLNLVISVIGLSVPEFAIIVAMQALTILSRQAGGETLWPILTSPGQARGWVVPMVAMSLAPLAYVARLSAGALDGVLRSDYIRTARSKGLPEWRIVLFHAGRNALPQLAAGLPTLLGLSMSSLIIVERMTLWPGLLKYVIDPGGQWRVATSGERFYTGATPEMMATATLLLLAWYLLMDGLARTFVIAATDTGREVQA
jgi:ABC-type dipeptide/oligopeptide/nickel transport system permease component